MYIKKGAVQRILRSSVIRLNIRALLSLRVSSFPRTCHDRRAAFVPYPPYDRHRVDELIDVLSFILGLQSLTHKPPALLQVVQGLVGISLPSPDDLPGFLVRELIIFKCLPQRAIDPEQVLRHWLYHLLSQH
jgi:hypothetical protein